VTFNELVRHYETEYPMLKTGHADYNEEQVKWVNGMVAKFIKAGDDKATALASAVDLAVSKFDLEPVSADKQPAADAKQGVEGKRKETAVDKAVKAAKAQAPAQKEVGLDSDKAGAGKINVHELPMAEFDKLPDAVIRRARGDLI
jgi:hypothetical protein